MHAELTCTCSAYMALEVKDRDSAAAWSLIWRFTNAHVECGFATGGAAVDDEDTQTLEA